MAYASGVQLSGIVGLVGAGIGGYFGYSQAAEIGMAPLTGALVLGGLGLIVASAGAFVLKSAVQFLIYAVMIGGVAFIFRNQIEALTGIDPINAVNSGLERFGITLPGFIKDA